jgi:hypothetical protein
MAARLRPSRRTCAKGPCGSPRMAAERLAGLSRARADGSAVGRFNDRRIKYAPVFASFEQDDSRALVVASLAQKARRISKMGNRNLRKLLVVGAHAVLFHRKPHTDPLRMWAKRLLEKKPFKLVAVALANKMARIAFAIMRGKTVYREIPA